MSEKRKDFTKFVMAVCMPEISENVNKSEVMNLIHETFPEDEEDVVIVDVSNMGSEYLQKFIDTGAIDCFVLSPEAANSMPNGEKIIDSFKENNNETNDKNSQCMNVFNGESEKDTDDAAKVGDLILKFGVSLRHLDIKNTNRVIAEQTFRGIQNDALNYRKMHQKLKGNIDDFAKDIVDKIATEKDEYTAKHVRSVSTIATAIAKKMDLSDEEIDILRIGTLLHDIGKNYVPTDLLNKVEKPTEEEFKIIHDHVVYGEIELNLYNLGKYERAKVIASQHHEKYDGTGYPRGLKGEEIDMLSRISSVADAAQAMFGRVYADGKTKDQLIGILRAESGKQFDPQVTEVLADILEHDPASIGVSYGENGEIKWDVQSNKDKDLKDITEKTVAAYGINFGNDTNGENALGNALKDLVYEPGEGDEKGSEETSDEQEKNIQKDDIHEDGYDDPI